MRTLNRNRLTLSFPSLVLAVTLMLAGCGGGGGGGSANDVNPGGGSTIPTVPTGLTATVLSPTEINLSWNASSDDVAVAGYFVNDGGVPSISMTTAHSFTNLAPATQYCFSVSAFDEDANESAQCSAVCATTDQLPATPWVTVRQGDADPIENVVWTGSKAVAVVNGFGSATILTSDDGLAWNRYPVSGFGFTGADDIAYGNGTFVALHGWVFTSPDGIAWSLLNPSPSSSLNALTWSAELALFVAVGDLGEVFTSPDGINWTAVNHGVTTENLYGVAALNGKLFAVGDEEVILTSADGINWSLAYQAPPAVAPDFNIGLETLAWNGKAGAESVYLAMGYNKAYTSTDGLSWSEVASPPGGFNESVVWGSAANGFVSVGSDSHVFFSSDGENWTRHYLPEDPYYAHTSLHEVAWTGSRFVAVGDRGMIIASADGITWEMLASGEDFYGVVWDGAQYIAMAGAGRQAMSATPTDWSYSYMGTDYHYLTDMTWNSDYYVAVGYGAGIYSPDLTTWYGSTSNILGKAAVVWDGTNFVRTTDYGILMWDGVTTYTGMSDPWWKYTLFDSSTPIYMHDIHWDGALLVSVGKNGVIYTSTDSSENSVAWTYRISGTTAELRGVAKGGSRYVAVGADGTILTSDDGAMTWSERTSGTTNLLSDVTWTGSEFIAVGYSGVILTSSDGITWSSYDHGSLDLNAVVSVGSDVVIVGDKGVIVRNNQP